MLIRALRRLWKRGRPVRVPRVAIHVDLDEEMEVDLKGTVPVSARFSEDLQVQVKRELHTTAAVDHVLEVPLNETLVVPLDLELDIPLDTQIHVKDTLKITATLDVDTVVTAMGVAPVPIKARLPIEMEVPLDQDLRIQGELRVPVRRMIEVPVSQVVKVPLKTSLPVAVSLDEALPCRLDTELHAEVEVAQTLPFRLKKALVIHGDRVTVAPDTGPAKP